MTSEQGPGKGITFILDISGFIFTPAVKKIFLWSMSQLKVYTYERGQGFNSCKAGLVRFWRCEDKYLGGGQGGIVASWITEYKGEDFFLELLLRYAEKK